MTDRQASLAWTPRELVHLLLVAAEAEPTEATERFMWRLRVLLISTEGVPQAASEIPARRQT